jgi:hypothetical protein
MNLRFRSCASILTAVASLAAAGAPTSAQTQDRQHVVTLDELHKQAARPAESRQENEMAIRRLLSSDIGQKALKSANVDYQRVDNAIGRLNDQELAKLAVRSRQAENDFAAGLISAKTLAYLILATVVIVVIVVLVT